MYENLCEILINNGARLIYTADRSVGDALWLLNKTNPAFYFEVSINEKVAFELSFTGSISSKRTACIMSTEGLYEALDPLMTSAYTGVAGGFVILCVKDTTEEITPLGPFSKLPVIICEDAGMFPGTIKYAYYISEKYEIPVIVQAEASVERGAENNNSKFKIQNSKFVKDPSRWAATPKFRLQLHKILNDKTEKIRDEFERFEGNRKIIHEGRTGIITSKREFLDFYSEDTSVLYLSTVYPLPIGLVDKFIEEKEEVYVIEGEYPVVEMQIPERAKIKAEHIKSAPERPDPEEIIYGFDVIRDRLGPASSINMAHGIKKLEPDKRLLAITFENHFLHSGMPAFVNVVYNNSSFVLLVFVSEKEEEIKKIMDGFGFHNYYHINNVAEIEGFSNSNELTVLFYRGII